MSDAPADRGEMEPHNDNEVVVGPDDETVAPEAGKPSRIQLLEEEGDIAADYLEELLDVADLDGDIDIDVVSGRAQLAIVSEGDDPRLQRLVGPNGEVLSALQELTRLMVQTATGNRSWLILDVDGFREDRKGKLRQRASAAIDTVRSTEEPLALSPMNAFERKVIHDEVAKADLRSESEGAGDGRHVVIYPK